MTSGSFTVGFASIKNASFDMTSGSINMTMPKDGGTVTVSKTSGKVYTNRECSISDNIYSFGSGEALIEVDMTSGKVRIS